MVLQVLCDTNVYVEAFRMQRQGFHAKQVFDAALAGEFQIAYCEIVRFEIANKYPYFTPALEEILALFSKNNALRPIEVSKEDLQRARELDKKLQKYDFFQKQYGKFGTNDCLFLVLAQEHGCLFLSCEKELVRAAREMGIDAASPMEFIS